MTTERAPELPSWQLCWVQALAHTNGEGIRGSWTAPVLRTYRVRPWEMEDLTPREWQDILADHAALKGGAHGP